MKTIFVGMPSSTGYPHPEVIFNLMYSVLPEWYKLIFDTKSIVVWQIVHRARNELVRRFLDWRYDYLLWCDDDNPPSIDALKYLIEDNKDIVSGIVPLRWWHAYNVTVNGRAIKSLKWLDSVFEIENFWWWFCLLSRKVIKDVFEHTWWYPYMFSPWKFVWNNEEWCLELYEWQTDINKYGSKDWKILIREWELWEDLYFWIKAKELWYKMYADKYAMCKHLRRNDSFITANDIENYEKNKTKIKHTDMFVE